MQKRQSCSGRRSVAEKLLRGRLPRKRGKLFPKQGRQPHTHTHTNTHTHTRREPANRRSQPLELPRAAEGKTGEIFCTTRTVDVGVHGTKSRSTRAAAGSPHRFQPVPLPGFGAVSSIDGSPTSSVAVHAEPIAGCGLSAELAAQSQPDRHSFEDFGVVSGGDLADAVSAVENSLN